MGMNAIRFAKMHGLGNDFMVIDTTKQPFVPTAAQIRQWADRHRGIGFDQLLIITKPPQPEIDFGYRIFNADGNEVGQCGNGVRCLARYIHYFKLSEKPRLTIATQTSVMTVDVLADGQVTVNMGVPNFSPSSLPFIVPAPAEHYSLTIQRQTVQFGAVSMGNPHAVILVDDIAKAPVDTIGAALMQHAAFPQAVNVGFVQVVNKQLVRVRVYERGVGETQACGSGACAAVAVMHQWQYVDNTVTVELAGGILQIQWQGETQPLWMTGPAELVYLGEIV
jgi:diaminopimelate epimerase